MRNIDRLGYIQVCCSFLTNLDRMNIVRRNIYLDDSISEIKRIKDDASVEKKDEYATNMIELAPKA